MKAWKAGALTGALVVAAGAGASISPVAHGQSRDREPMARAVQLLGGGAQIGVVVHDADSKDPAGGVVIDDVRSGSAADKAGFKDGDAVVEFDGERVRSVAQFQRLVRETPEDRSVQAVVVRDKQRVTLSVTPDRARGFDYSNDFPMLLRATPAPPAPPAVPRAARPYLTPTMPGFEAFTLRSSDVRLGIVT